MKKIIVAALAAMMVMGLSGCGSSSSDSSSSSAPVVDNSTRDGGQKNEYGYYGPNVLFGETKVANYWIIEDESGMELMTLFVDNGAGAITIIGYSRNAWGGNWGVNAPGTNIQMNLETDERIQIQLLSKLGPDCYEVVFAIEDDQYNSSMCKYVPIY